MAVTPSVLPTVPPEVVAAAHDATLGRHERVFRAVRPVSRRIAWWLCGLAAVGSVVVIIMGAAFVGVLLVPAALAGLLAYRYLVPPDAGRRWVSVYENGLVDAVATADGPRVVRWDEIGPVRLETFPAVEFTLTVVRPPVPVVSLVKASKSTVEEAAPEPLVLTGLHPADRLVALIDRHLPDRVPFARREILARSGHDSRRFAVALALLLIVPAAAYAVFGDAEVVGTQRLAVSLPARTSPPPVVVRTPTPPPSPTPALLPSTLLGFSDVCNGVTFAGAAPYGGPAPHYIVLSDPVYHGPAAWETADPSLVQLVGCFQRSDGPVLQRCRYSASNGVEVTRTVIRGDYAVLIREARGATVIAQAVLRGDQGNDCPKFTISFGAPTDTTVYTDLSDAQLQRAFGGIIG